MYKRYPGLSFVATSLKIIPIIIVLIGIVVSSLFIIKSDSGISWLIAIGGFVASIIVSILLYSFSDLFRCIMDIQENTRGNKQG